MGNTNCDRCGHDKKMCDCPTYVAQEGGDHYQADYQHWDWVIDAEIGYLAGNATKYVSRWRKKNGVDDLKKALTYVDKMIATRKNSDWHYRESRWRTNQATQRFVASAGLTEEEADIVYTLAGPCPPEMLKLARNAIAALIKSAQTAAGAGQRAAAPPARAGTATGAQQALRSGQRVRVGNRAGVVGFIASPATVQVIFGENDTDTFAEKDITILPSDGMEHPFGYDEERDA